ncbi:MAG: alginate lyase family protein [Sphingomicrobium sp.]
MPGDLARLFAFARHIPPQQVARRAALHVRRAAERHLRPSLDGPRATFSARAPLALFANPGGRGERLADGWRFRFLNRTEHCPAQIDWRLGGPGAANQLWRMNLHYFDWADDLDDEAYLDAVEQWIANYPPYAPGADQDGWNAYALSLRVVAWLKQLAARRGRLDQARVDHITDHAARQLRYLERHLETDIGGNHLFRNIRALLWGAAAIEGRDADRWRQLGVRLLKQELRQMLPDGMHEERSVSYHAQLLGDLLDIRRALGSDPLGGALDSAISRAAQVAADLAHPDGQVALFGDSGLSMAPAIGPLREAARAITGQGFAPRATFDLRQAGYAGARWGRDLLIVDAGPLGPDRLPGHAHGDIGSFEWSVAGDRLIVDQGVFTYVAGPERQAARSAGSHNTLAAQLADQGDFFGAFRLGRRCRVVRRRVMLDRDRFHLEVSHDGLVGPNGGARHQRSVDAGADVIVIEDQLDRALDGAAIGFLLAPGVEVHEAADGYRLISAHAECRIASDGEATIEDAMWWPDMGVAIPTRRLRFRLIGCRARTILTVLSRTTA